MTVHNLKIQRQPFEDLVSGLKTGEVRNCADREFREGDQVELFLIDETGNPANKSIVRTITHIQRGYGLPDDICVLSYAAPAVERQEPEAFMYQHDETGQIGFIDIQQIEWGFEKNNPRLKIICPLYRSPPAPVAVMLPELTDEQRDIEVTEMAEFMNHLSGGLRHFAGYLIDAGWRKPANASTRSRR